MLRMGSFYGQLFAGISEAGLRDREEALAVAREHGIVGLDFSVAELDAGVPDLLRKSGMQVASVHGAFRFPYATDAMYAESVRLMQESLDQAVTIGSPFFMMVPLAPEGEGDVASPAFRQAVRALAADLCRYAENKPIQVIFENFSTAQCPYTTFEEIDFLLENNPTLGFAYDSGNFPLAGFDEIEAAKRYAAQAVYVHLKDLKVVDESCPYPLIRRGVCYDSLELGGGTLKNAEALQILKNAGYTDGFVTIETMGKPFARTLKSADWLRDVFKQMGE